MGGGDFLYTRQGFFLVGKFFKASSFQAFKVLGRTLSREPKTWGAGTGARLPGKMLKIYKNKGAIYLHPYIILLYTCFAFYFLQISSAFFIISFFSLDKFSLHTLASV